MSSRCALCPVLSLVSAMYRDEARPTTHPQVSLKNRNASVLALGYRQSRPGTTDGMLGLQNIQCLYPNSMVSELHTEPWEELLPTVSPSYLHWLLVHATVVQVFPQHCFVQVAGRALTDVSWRQPVVRGPSPLVGLKPTTVGTIWRRKLLGLRHCAAPGARRAVEPEGSAEKAGVTAASDDGERQALKRPRPGGKKRGRGKRGRGGDRIWKLGYRAMECSTIPGPISRE